MLVALLLLLILSNLSAGGATGDDKTTICDKRLKLYARPHSVSISEFGAVGDGKTLNTVAFQNAIFYLKSFADKGGAQLYVPPGRWLTGSFNLTSHLTLFLEKGAVILASPEPSHWDMVDPLPSYGQGTELPGKRYRSLINGDNLQDVVITGHNGTIDGQGSVWWEWLQSGSLNHSRPHLVEFISSKCIVVSNLTFLNAPTSSIHPVYCSHVNIQNVLIESTPESPTVGIVPDSSDYVCIEDSTINMGHDAISLKSGWDEYGIKYGRPTTDTHIRRLRLKSFSGAGISLGSEMSGGISNVKAEHLHLHDSLSGVSFETTKGRGGYISNITISNVELANVDVAIVADGHSGSHPDDKFDPDALPIVTRIILRNITGVNIGLAGNFTGLKESPFTSIYLSDISLSIRSESSTSWICSYVSGYSESVFPESCPELKTSNSADATISGVVAAALSDSR